MDILNKSYKRKNAPESDIFVVDKIDGDFVVFTNGARCKKETLMNDFQDITTHGINDDVTLNVDTFFNTPSADNAILEQIEKIHNNPSAVIHASSKLHESNSLDNDKQYEKTVHGQATPQNSFTSRLSDDAETLQSGKSGGQVAAARLPEWDVFDNVKLSDEIEITIPFKIKLPRAEKIDVLNDMFKTSFTAYLAKKYINDNIINNSAKLLLTLQKSIEEWVESELDGARKRKPAKRSKSTKIETAKEIGIQTEVTETVIAVDTPTDTASSFFGNIASGPVWDGDVMKLFVINTEEQYNAVKKRFIQLKDVNSNSVDLDRFEDMLETYETENK